MNFAKIWNGGDYRERTEFHQIVDLKQFTDIDEALPLRLKDIEVLVEYLRDGLLCDDHVVETHARGIRQVALVDPAVGSDLIPQRIWLKVMNSYFLKLPS